MELGVIHNPINSFGNTPFDVIDKTNMITGEVTHWLQFGHVGKVTKKAVRK